jgi:hypothetical protein
MPPQKPKKLIDRLPIDRIISTAAAYEAIAAVANCKLGDVPQLSDTQLKGVVELAATRIVTKALPKIERNYDELLDSEDDKIKLQASRDMAQATGILPSHAQSVVISNSFNKQSVELTPEVLEMMRLRPAHRVIGVDMELDD